MDWITQAALGATIGELAMGRRLGKRALAWGALIGALPDMDFLVSPVLDTAREIAWHRGPLHSLPVMALGTWAISRGLARLWKREKIAAPAAAAFVLAVWWVHVLADCLSAEGAAVLWPFTARRFSFGILDGVDFLFSAPLVACAVWLAIARRKLAPKTRGKKPAAPLSKRPKWCSIALAASAAYAALAGGMKYRAAAGFDADLARRDASYGRRLDTPTRFNILLWRAVVDRGGEFWIGYRSVFEPRGSRVRWTVYPQGGEALAPVAAARETKTLLAVTDGWWLARPHAKGAWFGDLRLPETRVWGSKKGMVDTRLPRSWVIEISEKSHHLRTFPADAGDPADFLQRLANRAFSGTGETWEANPRLAGVAGSLPEFLAVEE